MSVNHVKGGNPSAVSGNPAPSTSETSGAEKSASIRNAAASYAKSSEKRPATVSEAANVQISQKAREMSQARKIIDETPDIREDKVAKFKSLIAKGEYKPDAGKIADGMLNEAIRDELSKNPDSVYE